MSALGINSITAGAFVGSIISGILVFAIGTQMGKTTSTTRLVLIRYGNINNIFGTY